MKRKLLFASATFIGASLMFSSLAPAQIERRTASDERLITVLNPAIATRMAERKPLMPRLDTLEGKTIYLVDTNWGGLGESDGIQQEIQAWFAKNMPSVKTVIKMKRSNFVTDDPALWKEISDKKGDGVIIGVAG